MSAQSMRNAWIASVVVGLVFMLSAVAKGVSEEPNTQQVVYRLHEDPNDPDSDVKFTIWLSLEQEDVDGDCIGWSITRIRIRQIGEGGDPDTIWKECDPHASTPDGLWWVEHASVENPVLKEFVKPPLLTGSATPEDPNDANLEYGFEGDDYDPGSMDPPWGLTAALTYEFTLQGGPEALASNEDEPAEVDDEDDPPTSSG